MREPPLCRSTRAARIAIATLARRVAWTFAIALALSSPASASDVRLRQAGAAPAPKYMMLFHPPARWPAPPTFYYNPANAPARFVGHDQVIATIRDAFAEWQAACGLGIAFGGLSNAPVGDVDVRRDGTSVIGWTETDDPYFAAQADVIVADRDAGADDIVEADVLLFANSGASWSEPREVFRIMVHEIGHALGLGHSEVAGAVMSGPPLSPYNDNAWLTDDDASGCRSLYRPEGWPATVRMIEFYRPGVDHYFATWNANEIAQLDAGTAIRGWQRTGRSWHAYAQPGIGLVPVCRLYLPPAIGDSHFFGRGEECGAVQRAIPGIVVESSGYVYAGQPEAGTCPRGTTPLFRFFNGRSDTNHRYVVDPADRALMIARGWIPEGDGPAAVTLCLP